MSQAEIDLIHSRCIEEGNCWIWQGATDGQGRPQMRKNGKVVYVRRFLRGLVDGEPVPSRLVVSSHCGVLKCVSPECSLACTPKTRGQLAGKRGAFNRPDKILRLTLTKRSLSRFSEEVVQRVRDAEGPARVIAMEVGMSISHAKAIRRGASRAPITPFSGLSRLAA